MAAFCSTLFTTGSSEHKNYINSKLSFINDLLLYVEDDDSFDFTSLVKGIALEISRINGLNKQLAIQSEKFLAVDLIAYTKEDKNTIKLNLLACLNNIIRKNKISPGYWHEVLSTGEKLQMVFQEEQQHILSKLNSLKNKYIQFHCASFANNQQKHFSHETCVHPMPSFTKIDDKVIIATKIERNNSTTYFFIDNFVNILNEDNNWHSNLVKSYDNALSDIVSMPASHVVAYFADPSKRSTRKQHVINPFHLISYILEIEEYRQSVIYNCSTKQSLFNIYSLINDNKNIKKYTGQTLLLSNTAVGGSEDFYAIKSLKGKNIDTDVKKIPDFIIKSFKISDRGSLGQSSKNAFEVKLFDNSLVTISLFKSSALSNSIGNHFCYKFNELKVKYLIDSSNHSLKILRQEKLQKNSISNEGKATCISNTTLEYQYNILDQKNQDTLYGFLGCVDRVSHLFYSSNTAFLNCSSNTGMSLELRNLQTGQPVTVEFLAHNYLKQDGPVTNTNIIRISKLKQILTDNSAVQSAKKESYINLMTQKCLENNTSLPEENIKGIKYTAFQKIYDQARNIELQDIELKKSKNMV